MSSNLPTGGVDFATSNGWYFMDPTSVTYVNDTLLNASFTTTYTQHIGAYNVEINTYSPTPPLKLVNGFTVTAGPHPPVLNSISPSSVIQGNAVSVHITASNTHFLAGTNTVTIGGYTPSSISVINDSTLDANFFFGYNVSPGTRYVDVYNAIDGTLTLNNAFTVNAGPTPPSLKSINPIYGRRGQTITISLIGTNTHFQSYSNIIQLQHVVYYGPSPTLVNVTNINDTLMNATFSFSNADSLGYYNVYVPSTANGNPMILSNAFRLYPAGSSIINVSPNSGTLGSALTVTVQAINSHYLAGTNSVQAQSVYGGALITGSGVTVINDSTLSTTFTFSATDINGKYSVQVNNVTDGLVKIDSALILYQAPGSPQIVSVNPPYATIGYNTNVLIKAKGTNFLQGIDSLRLHNWVNDLSPSNLTINNDSEITATFFIPGQTSPNLSYYDVVIWDNMPLVYANAIQVEYPLQIDDITVSDEFAVFPNPTSGIFTVAAELPISSLEVFDLTGRVILHQNNLDKKQNIDISVFPAGMYYLKVTTAGGNRTGKIVKE
jgi:hypothetical protein